MFAYLALFVFITFLYIFVSIKKKKIIHFMFFQYVSQGIVMVFLYLLGLIVKKDFSLNNGDIILLVYFALEFLIFAVVALYYKPPKKKIKSIKKRYNNVRMSIFFGAAVVLLVAILVVLNAKNIALAITNPRMFYANTRLGGGAIYYIFIPCVIFLYFVYIFHLDYRKKKEKKKSLIKAAIATLIVTAVVYIFGQKANIVLIAFIFMAVYFFKSSKVTRNKNILIIGAGFAVAFLAVFALYSLQQNINFDNIFLGMATYSDYLGNFSLLVDNLEEFSFGKTMLQDEFVGYIPRAIWSGKPELYGSLALGLNVPSLVEWTQALTGAPSFGPLGPSYADFGAFCIPISLFIKTIFALKAKEYELLLNKKVNFFIFFKYLTFCGILIFNITLTVIPLYQLAVIFVIEKTGFRLKKKKKVTRTNENINQCVDIVG